MSTKRDEIRKKLDMFFESLFPKQDNHTIEFASQKLEDGTIIEYESLNIGTEVFVVDETGNLTPLTDGQYTIAEGKMIIDEGKILSITTDETTADPSQVKNAEDPKEVPAEDSNAMKLDFVPVEEVKTEAKVGDPIPDGIYLTPEGVQFTVEKGVITDLQQIMKEQVKMSSMKLDFEKEKKELIEKFKTQIDELTKLSKESGIIQAPKADLYNAPITANDIILNNIRNKR